MFPQCVLSACIHILCDAKLTTGQHYKIFLYSYVFLNMIFYDSFMLLYTQTGENKNVWWYNIDGD